MTTARKPLAGIGGTGARTVIDPRKLAFDIDGVVADTMRLFIDILKEVYGVNHIRIRDITQYELEACLDVDPGIIRATTDRITEGDYPCRLLPMPGAGDVLARLSGYGPIRLVTARPHPGPLTAWMDALLPARQHGVEITTTGSFDTKAGVLLTSGVEFFVEDRLETCFSLQSQGIKPILFVQPWNRQPHPFIEMRGWHDLDAMIDWKLQKTKP